MELIGQRFGKRVVLREDGRARSREKMYLCRCDCGRETRVRGNALRKGLGNGCHGCAAAQTKNRATHGMAKIRPYNIWTGMMKRCHNPLSASYQNYGGRGIFVCEEWHDLNTFLAWAEMGYKDGLTIDRINVNDGYTPSNCRWATRAQQTENVRLLTASNKSGYRGVSKKHGRNMWLARVMISGKIIHLGHHKTALDAAKAHDAYILESGLLRPVNFPYEIEARANEWPAKQGQQ